MIDLSVRPTLNRYTAAIAATVRERDRQKLVNKMIYRSRARAEIALPIVAESLQLSRSLEVRGIVAN